MLNSASVPVLLCLYELRFYSFPHWQPQAFFSANYQEYMVFIILWTGLFHLMSPSFIHVVAKQSKTKQKTDFCSKIILNCDYCLITDGHSASLSHSAINVGVQSELPFICAVPLASYFIRSFYSQLWWNCSRLFYSAYIIFIPRMNYKNFSFFTPSSVFVTFCCFYFFDKINSNNFLFAFA